jgi:hypothetical protein
MCNLHIRMNLRGVCNRAFLLPHAGHDQSNRLLNVGRNWPAGKKRIPASARRQAVDVNWFGASFPESRRGFRGATRREAPASRAAWTPAQVKKKVRAQRWPPGATTRENPVAERAEVATLPQVWRVCALSDGIGRMKSAGPRLAKCTRGCWDRSRDWKLRYFARPSQKIWRCSLHSGMAALPTWSERSSRPRIVWSAGLWSFRSLDNFSPRMRDTRPVPVPQYTVSLSTKLSWRA